MWRTKGRRWKEGKGEREGVKGYVEVRFLIFRPVPQGCQVCESYTAWSHGHTTPSYPPPGHSLSSPNTHKHTLYSSKSRCSNILFLLPAYSFICFFFVFLRGRETTTPSLEDTLSQLQFVTKSPKRWGKRRKIKSKKWKIFHSPSLFSSHLSNLSRGLK